MTYQLLDPRFSKPKLEINGTPPTLIQDEPPEPTPILFASSKAPILLQGIYFSSHIQTEERLTVRIEGLHPETFREASFLIEDWAREIDDKYKIKRVRGRSWQGKGAKIEGIRRRIGKEESVII